MSPYGRSRPANGDSSRKFSSSSRRRSRSLTSNFLFLWVCLMMAFSPPPFLTFSLNSTYLPRVREFNEWHAFTHLFKKKTDRSRTYFLQQALPFRRLASYTCRWMGRRGCSSTGKALRRALLFLAAELIQRTEQCQCCSASLQSQHFHAERRVAVNGAEGKE